MLPLYSSAGLSLTRVVVDRRKPLCQPHLAALGRNHNRDGFLLSLVRDVVSRYSKLIL